MSREAAERWRHRLKALLAGCDEGNAPEQTVREAVCLLGLYGSLPVMRFERKHTGVWCDFNAGGTAGLESI